ncbi:8893_t:CDS:1, partial [Scutellospora calospora]
HLRWYVKVRERFVNLPENSHTATKSEPFTAQLARLYVQYVGPCT